MAKQTSTTPVKQTDGETSAKKWYAVLSEFLQSVGLYETIRGFEADLLVLSRAQHERLPSALQTLGEEVLVFSRGSC
jgi:hypothetical protein